MACVLCLAVFAFAIKTAVAQAVERSATVGETVVLPCSATLDSPVDWLYQASPTTTEVLICIGGNVVSAYTTRFSINSTHSGIYDLHINDLQPSDAGVYTCVEDRGLGGRHPSTLLHVVEGVGGIVTIASRNVTKLVGESVSFTCTTKTSHPVRWTRVSMTKSAPSVLFIGSKKYPFTSHRYYVTVDSVRSTLTVSHLELSDSGVIMCQMSTADVTDGLSFGLTVILPRGTVQCGILTNSSREVIRRVGESVTFTCATCPSYQIRWAKSNTTRTVPTVLFIGDRKSPLTSHRYDVNVDSVASTLTLLHLELCDTGVIMCREWTADVTDELSFNLTVINSRAPRTSDYTELIREPRNPASDDSRGEAVRLETSDDATRIELPCHTSLDTAVDWWYQSSPDVNVRQVCLNGDIVIDLRSRLSIKSSAPGDYNLVINRPKVSDSGIYTCVEDAGLGPGRFEFRLIVNGSTKTPPWSPVGVIVLVLFVSLLVLAVIIIVMLTVSRWRGIDRLGVIKNALFSRAKRRHGEQNDDALRTLNNESSSMPKRQSSCSIQATPNKTNDTMTSPTYPHAAEQHPIIDRHQRETDF